MRPSFLLPVALVMACGGESAVPLSDPRILIIGNDMGPLTQSIVLSRGSSPVTAAEVSVNGTFLAETAPGHYAGQLPSFLSIGDSVRLRVIAGLDTIDGAARVPSVPALLGPLSGTAMHIPDPLPFTWIDATDPDEFRASIRYDSLAETSAFPGSARSGMVVTSRIPVTSVALSAYLYAYADGTFTGPAHPDSKMHVRQSTAAVTLVLQR